MYTSILRNTHTEPHTIAPVSKEPVTFADKLTSAKGSGLTSSAIKKVANFIGMDEAALGIEGQPPVQPGMLSVDLQLEAQAWEQSAKRMGALEDAEMLRRLTNPDAEMKRKVLAIFTSRRVQNDLINPPKLSYNRPVSRRFLQHIRQNLNVIEESERSRRMADNIGELLRKELAKEVTYKILIGLQTPQLRPTTHLINAPWPFEQSSGLQVFGGAALTAGRHLAESAAISAYQVADFALRVGKFFGPKAATKGQIIGQQALKTGQVLGHEAIDAAKVLGHVALEKTQSLGHQAVAGAQSLSHKAVVGAIDTAHQVSDVAVDTAIGAQRMAEQAMHTAKELQDQTKAAVVKAVDDWFTPTLSWKDISSLEEDERSLRNNDNFDPRRLMLAMRTSQLMRGHWGVNSENPSYGTRALEEMERFERRSGDQSHARANAKRLASIVNAQRQMLAWNAAQTRTPSVELTQAAKSPLVFASGLLNPSFPSKKLSSEVAAPAQSQALRGLELTRSTPVLNNQPVAVPSYAPLASATGDSYVSQAAMDAFAKAFTQNAPVAVYRPAM